MAFSIAHIVLNVNEWQYSIGHSCWDYLLGFRFNTNKLVIDRSNVTLKGYRNVFYLIIQMFSTVNDFIYIFYI